MAPDDAPRTQTPAIDDGDGAATTCESRADTFIGWPKFLSPSGELAGQAQAQTQILLGAAFQLRRGRRCLARFSHMTVPALCKKGGEAELIEHARNSLPAKSALGSKLTVSAPRTMQMLRLRTVQVSSWHASEFEIPEGRNLSICRAPSSSALAAEVRTDRNRFSASHPTPVWILA